MPGCKIGAHKIGARLPIARVFFSYPHKLRDRDFLAAGLKQIGRVSEPVSRGTAPCQSLECAVRILLLARTGLQPPERSQRRSMAGFETQTERVVFYGSSRIPSHGVEVGERKERCGVLRCILHRSL